MTINEAIERVNNLKENSLDDKRIKEFITDIDKRVYIEVINTHEGKDESIKPYEERYPLQGNDELLANDAYTQFYIYYALAQIDYFNDEINRYNNNMTMFNNYYTDFKNWYNRTHRPIGCKRFITD